MKFKKEIPMIIRSSYFIANHTGCLWGGRFFLLLKLADLELYWKEAKTVYYSGGNNGNSSAMLLALNTKEFVSSLVPRKSEMHEIIDGGRWSCKRAAENREHINRFFDFPLEFNIENYLSYKKEFTLIKEPEEKGETRTGFINPASLNKMRPAGLKEKDE